MVIHTAHRVNWRPALLFLGAPGVGKGTYASYFSKKWKVPHLSIGEIIRQEIAAGTSFGQRFKDQVRNGELLPDEDVSSICRRRMNETDCAQGWILDGFPRTLAQAQDLQSFASPALCVSFVLPDDILLKKLLGRRICAQCRRGYNVAEFYNSTYELPPLNPPSDCPLCHGNPKLLTREDDSESIFKQRLNTYKINSAPLFQWYSQKNILLEFEMKKGIKDLPLLDLSICSHINQLQFSSTPAARSALA